MYTSFNVFDEKVIEGILKGNCDFNKNMSITEVLDIILNNKEKYATNVIYSPNTMVLHIDGINGFRTNISVKQKKIIVTVYNNKNERNNLIHDLDFEDKPIGEIHALLLHNFVDQYKNYDLENLWKLINKDSDIESIDYIFSILIRENIHGKVLEL